MSKGRGAILNSLALRVVASVSAVVILMGIVLYFFVLSQISKFADESIRTAMSGMSDHVFGICERNLSELVKSRESGNAGAVRIKKTESLAMIGEYLAENGIKGTVLEQGREVMQRDVSAELLKAITEKTREHEVTTVAYGGRKYYAHHSYFKPWNWHLILADDASHYSSLVSGVGTAYTMTGLILLLAAATIIFYLKKTVQGPVNQIVGGLLKGEKPAYKGIYEFEFLSDSLREIMERREQENRMLNNIYHIAASRRGAEFFDEVALSIARMFDLNCMIGRTIPDSDNAEVFAMHFEGELQRNVIVSLKDTPCEGVVTKKHMCVIERNAFREYPRAEALTKTMADAYIGVAVFNRRGEAIGIVNAFGKQREFTESDIKVFQTIGQIVATELEMIEKDRQEERIREELFQSQKMEAVGTLAGGIAHDFNNMLQGILGYASLLKMKVPPEDPVYRPLEVIEHSAEKAAELTRQLLGFARKGKYVVEPCNLNTVIEDALKIVTRTFPRTIDIRTNLSGDLWMVEADRNQIEHVILNLCINARDAMPAGGVLLLETSNREIADAAQSHAVVKPGKYVVLRVSDSGIGMDEEVKKHIFEPFFTTKEKGQGTGMGLAMVYGVVKNHEGSVQVESEFGKGSVFTLSFPAALRKAGEGDTGEHVLPHGKGTILIVDDEEFIRNFAREILERLGYAVIEASNGSEAIEAYRDGNQKIDLIILDLVMPRMGGEEAYQKLRKINPEVKVLISSGYGIGETRDAAKFEGIVGFIQKPFKVTDIANAVGSAMSSV